MGTYLVHNINEYLGIVHREVFDHLDLIIIRENCRNQSDMFIYGKGIADQLFPDRSVRTICGQAKGSFMDGVASESGRWTYLVYSPEHFWPLVPD